EHPAVLVGADTAEVLTRQREELNREERWLGQRREPGENATEVGVAGESAAAGLGVYLDGALQGARIDPGLLGQPSNGGGAVNERRLLQQLAHPLASWRERGAVGGVGHDQPVGDGCVDDGPAGRSVLREQRRRPAAAPATDRQR